MPEAEASVEGLRLLHDPSAALGAPAHLTVLVPFVPLVDLDQDELALLLAAHAPFDFELVSVEHFGEEVTYLEPRPAAPFAALTEAVWRRWPDHPPYAGEHAEVVPHLTVGLGRVDVHARLPIRCRASEVLLLEEGDGGRWSAVGRFPLGAG